MYLVQWDDHTGLHHQRLFRTPEEAALEAAYLEASNSVEHVWPVELVEERSKEEQT